jgi:hypothetical protein
MTQIRQEVKLRDGKVIVRGQLGVRKTVKSADIVLYHKPNIALAVIEAKANKHEMGKGMQQGLDYARLLDVPFIFASNGDGFIFHDKTLLAAGATNLSVESEIALEDFPSPSVLWEKFRAWKGYTDAQLPFITQDYFDDGSGKAPRYYQVQAVNKTLEAVSRGENRNLLVMATGTGKTYTAFQIIWRLWKAKQKKRILFLADRNILIDQTRINDFEPFGQAMTKITGRTIDPAYEIHLALYQALTGPEESQKAYNQVKPDFFDLIIIDECHRGSAAEDSAWREILEYFSSATQIGMTATPKETKEVSNIDYLGDPASQERLLHPYFDSCFRNRQLSCSISCLDAEFRIVELEIEYVDLTEPLIDSIKFHVEKIVRPAGIIGWLTRQWTKLRFMPLKVVQTLPRRVLVDLVELQGCIRDALDRHDESLGTPNNWHSIFHHGLLESEGVLDWLFARHNGIIDGSVDQHAS